MPRVIGLAVPWSLWVGAAGLTFTTWKVAAGLLLSLSCQVLLAAAAVLVFWFLLPVVTCLSDLHPAIRAVAAR